MKKQILVLTSYPKKGTIHGVGTVGIASYTKNTLLHLKKLHPSLSFHILAEVLDKKNSYTEDGMDIERLWKRNDLNSLFTLCTRILTGNYTQVLIPFEVYMLGNTFFAGIFLILLSFLKILGKKITLVLHQVPETIEDVEKDSLRAKLFPLLKHILYFLITFSAEKVVVFEEKFKERLGSRDNIVIIPHAVEPVKKLPQAKAKQLLKLDINKPLILYFGFLSPYKGVDQLVEAWDKDTETNLIMAGGGNPNHMNNLSYTSYIDNLYQRARSKNIYITGFVKEDDIPLYFSAADIVILPYRTFFSSSGPLSLAFAYEKPILLSPPLKAYFETHDFQNGRKKAGLEQKMLISAIEKNTLKGHVSKLIKNYDRYQVFSKEMKKMRSWETIAPMYAKLFGD